MNVCLQVNVDNLEVGRNISDYLDVDEDRVVSGDTGNGTEVAHLITIYRTWGDVFGTRR